MSKKKILHISPYGKGYNIGNFAISLAVRKLLNLIYESPVIISVPAHGLPSSGLNKKVIYEANTWADGIVVGGGNLYENNELEIDFNALESLQVPLALYSISIGRIYNRRKNLGRRTDVMEDQTLQALHRYATVSLARDEATSNHLERLGISNVVLGGCPTLQLSKLVPKDLGITRNSIYVSIRTPELMNIPQDVKLGMPEFVLNTVKSLESVYGVRPILLCHDQRDLAFASSFSGYDCYFTPDVYEYLDLIASAKLIVSMRVHATLPCLSYGTPVINISYDERGTSLMKTIGMAEWDINLMDGFAEVDEQIQDRLANIGNLKTMIASCEAEWGKLKKLQMECLSVF